MKSLGVAAMCAVLVCGSQAALATEKGIEIPTGPINCSTAEGDLRALNAEKDYVKKKSIEGVLAVTPAGALFGLVTGTEHERLELLNGDYERQIDARMLAIQTKCNVKSE